MKILPLFNLASLLAVAAVGPVFVGAVKSWSGHKVVRLTPHDTRELQVLFKLITENPRLDVWKGPSGVNRTADIQMTPSEYEDLTRYLKQHGLETSVLIDDINSLIVQQRGSVQKTTSHHLQNSEYFDYSRYHKLEELQDCMKQMVYKHQGIVTLFNVAKSYEGRDMFGLKISVRRSNNRSAFWIQGGIHAREWISPATVIYMAGQMLEKYGKDDSITSMLRNFDWYILPVTNPDGYVYTWENQWTRMWRKTRSRHGGFYGVDPNRNWDMKWCEAGASTDPWSDIYCGPKPFSEVEVKGVADFLDKIPNLKGFIDFHSYSQLWMSPWGYTKDIPEDFNQQDAGSTAAVKALWKIRGTRYMHGRIASLLYEASGSATDWVYGRLGVKYSYAVELRDTGNYGFLLPPDQIIPSGEETLAALIALAEFVYNN